MDANIAHLCSHLQLYNLDAVRNDGRFISLVESIREHLHGICMELV